MNILILGGSGFIGRALGQYLSEKGHLVYLGTRQSNYKVEPPLQAVYWTADAPAPLSNLHAIINLAGAPISRFPWTQDTKSKILYSRVSTTKALSHALESGFYTPKVVINGSAIGIYGNRGEQELLECDVPIAPTDFLSQVASAWELEAQPMSKTTRLVLLRTAIVLGPGGMLQKVAVPYQYGIGGPLGNGRQWLSWIHLQDLVHVIEHILLNDDLHGPINACAPIPVTQNQFSKTLAHALHRPNLLRVPQLALKLLLGEGSQVILSSQKAKADTLLSSGYSFLFPSLEEALRDLYPQK